MNNGVGSSIKDSNFPLISIFDNAVTALAAISAQHVARTFVSSHIFHTTYSTFSYFSTHYLHQQLIMPFTLVQLSFLTKRATRFTIRHSSLKLSNINSHFWTRWTKQITHIRRLIRFVLRHVDISLKISIGPMEINISPTPHNRQAVGEENV